MTVNDFLAHDRSLNGNHTPACALPTRGGVCDCWPPMSNSEPWAQRPSAGEPGADTTNGLGSQLVLTTKG